MQLCNNNLDLDYPAPYIRTMKALRSPHRNGFTMVEVLAVIAAMAAIGAIGYVTVTHTKTSADSAKLDSDVASINRSIEIFEASGGNITSSAFTGTGTAGVESVLTELKTRDSNLRNLGVTGSTLDARVWYRPSSSADPARAVWNAGTKRFEVVQSGGVGVKEFIFDEARASTAPAQDTYARTTTKETSSGDGWVWDHAPATEVASVIGSTPQTGVVDTALSVAINQNFQSGYWTINPGGSVNVNYVFREAGYNSRLALFSLEGMGPDVYNLDTAAGQKAFLLEAMRRVIAGDRAQVIIDAATSSQGFNQTYTFRPGDTVAAIMIPNSSFATAYSNLNNNVNNSQTYPLTSLARGAGIQAPFYANQYAPLGTNTNAYAIEDMQVTNNANVGSIDYQDLIFTADGMTAANQSMPYTISDPVAKFRADPYWNRVGSNGTLTLRQALITAGIIPANTPL